MLRIQECLEDTAPFLQLLHCFLPSPFCVSWALQGDTDAPLKAGYSTTTYSLHFDHLWTSALTSTNYKFLSPKLTVALNYKHKQNILKKMFGQETSCPFSKTAVAYTLWPMSSPVTGLWPGLQHKAWSRSYHGLVTSVTLMPLLHQWKHLT